MVLLEKNFKHKKEGSSKLIASLQKGTRHLQNVCGHAKLEKYVALAAKVPYLKKSLEIFIYRAKAMLAANNCLEAFDLGILKNKDLKGQEIITQQAEIKTGLIRRTFRQRMTGDSKQLMENRPCKKG